MFFSRKEPRSHRMFSQALNYCNFHSPKSRASLRYEYVNLPFTKQVTVGPRVFFKKRRCFFGEEKLVVFEKGSQTLHWLDTPKEVCYELELKCRVGVNLDSHPIDITS